MYKLLAGLCLCLSSFCSLAETSIWKVSKNGQELYLGGTIHLLRESDYPLPQEFQQAYQQAQTLVFETDSELLQQPQQQQQFIRLMTLKEGQTLAQLLSPKTYLALKQAVTSRGLPWQAMQRFSPVAISIQLTVMEMKRLGMTAAGVDDHFFSRARADNKNIITFETPLQQMGFIRELAYGQEDQFVRYSLQDLVNIPAQMQQLTSAWRSGNRRALAATGVDEWRDKFPDVYQKLLVQRNNRWLPKIEAMLQTRERELILVGALHLVGEHGLLQQLQQRGYRITQL